MSSLVRRIQKRIAKAQGFYRSRADIYIDPHGEQLGYIKNSDNERVGLHWPQVQAPTRWIDPDAAPKLTKKWFKTATRNEGIVDA